MSALLFMIFALNFSIIKRENKLAELIKSKKTNLKKLASRFNIQIVTIKYVEV